MSAFDEVLAEYEAPSAEDIVLPGRAAGNAAANKGNGGNGRKDTAGTAATTPAAAAGSTPAGSTPAGTSGTAPEPEPQLPEGSDDEDKAAAEAEEVEQAEAAAAEEAAAEALRRDEEAAEEAASEQATEDAGDESGAAAEAPAPSPQAEPLPMIPRRRPGLVFDGETSQLKQFPKALIEQMRELLRPRLGDAFARDISQNSIVTALAIAALGVDFKTDESTALAVQAFRENDPRTELLEERTKTLLEKQEKSLGVLRNMVEKLAVIMDTTAVLEMGQAYALAERTAVLATDGVLPETIDVTQPRALSSRENIRKRVKAQQQADKDRAGRPIR